MGAVPFNKLLLHVAHADDSDQPSPFPTSDENGQDGDSIRSDQNNSEPSGESGFSTIASTYTPQNFNSRHEAGAEGSMKPQPWRRVRINGGNGSRQKSSPF